MDLPVHFEILWNACLLARARLGGSAIADPVQLFPLLARGVWLSDTQPASAYSDLRFGKSGSSIQSQLDDRMRTFFDAYWADELRRVFHSMGQFDGDATAA